MALLVNKSDLLKESSLKQQVITSLAWLGSLKFVGQILTWTITLIVIRLLSPADYGIMAMAHVCIGFLTMISELGMGSTIVQKESINDQQLAQIFGFIIISNSVITLVVFLGAPAFAKYFDEPQLTKIFRVLSVNFILLSLYIIPQSILLRKMDFRRKSIVDFAASLISVSITLILALSGWGVWALVFGSISIQIVSIFGYHLFCRFFMWPYFSLKGVKDLISFAAFLTGTRILWYFYSKADIIIGGRFLLTKALGIYSVALQLSFLPIEKILPIINQVAFPAYSHIQSDTDYVRHNFLKTVRITSLFFFPLYWGLLIVAPEIIMPVLGSKWNGVILPLQMLCAIMPLMCLRGLFSPALNGLGRSDVEFYNMLIAAIFMPIAFLVGVKWGIKGLCMGWIIGYPIIFVIATKRCLNVLQLSFSDLFINIKTPILSSSFMLIGVILLKKQIIDLLFPLYVGFLLVGFGAAIYILAVFYIDRPVFCEIQSLLPFFKNSKV